MILKPIFYLDIISLFSLLAGITWSISLPKKRIWPPPNKSSWQQRLAWILFYLVFGLNTLIIFLDWNNWIFSNPLRFLIGIPLILVGSSLLVWGIRHLGMIIHPG